MKRTTIRLLVVGEELVGKSTLINTIYSELSTQTQKTLRKVILPPQMCMYSKDIFTQIIDTSSEMDLTPQINEADLVLLVYDVSDRETVDRIQTDWLPRICAASSKVPIILVGNKMDKKELQFQDQNESEYIKVKDVLKKVTKRFKNVQMGIQCSAFYDRNVKSVLNCAQRAVLYPLSPLYNLQTRSITPDFHKALIRIFRILDTDMDGKLYDPEINKLQQRVFQSQLNLQDIKSIKQIIIKQLQSDQQEYIELQGFIALQKKCIQMLKIQICWSILRYFGYNDDLRIDRHYINKTYSINSNDSVELVPQAIDFLIRLQSLFQVKKQRQKKMDQEYSQFGQHQTILSQIFKSAPEINFPQFSSYQDMSEEKFITAWNLYAFIDCEKCYKDLLYLGWEQSMDETFSKKKSKKSYKDYQKLKDSKLVSVLFIHHHEYQSYIKQLFVHGQQIETEDGTKYLRDSVLHRYKNFSKIYLIFLLHKNHFQSFFNDPQTQFAKRIDIVIDLSRVEHEEDIKRHLPPSILYRKISSQECQDVLKANQPPELDLQAVPVKYKQGSYDSLFSIIQQSLQKIELGLPQWKIQELKKENKKQNQLYVYSMLGVSALVLIGALAVKTKGITFWK